ncbi:MAG: hypothetical protein KGL39_39300 [Patescibacteria group bacterium]|nr:hypothetical protein [Patescibacteria group bacterium]
MSIANAIAPPQYVTSPHRLNRAQMERIIREEKGSVMHKGKIYHKVEDLPSEAQLAMDDPAQKDTAEKNLQAQIDNLQAQLKALQTGTVSAAPTAGPTPWNGLVGDPSLTPRLQPAQPQPIDQGPANPPSTDTSKDAARAALLDNDDLDTPGQTPAADPKPKGRRNGGPQAPAAGQGGAAPNDAPASN